MDVREYIKQNEGLSLKPYICTGGKITIGVGHNLTDNGISENIADMIFSEDLDQAVNDLWSIFDPDKISKSNDRHVALIDLMFNLGKTRFLTFKRMIQAIKEKNWDKAANELLDSKYATQVGQRAINNANFLRKG